MAERVEALPSGHRFVAKYPWKDWLDGSTWKLTPGVDFLVGTRSFLALVYNAAARHKKKVRVRERQDGVYVQAYEAAGE